MILLVFHILLIVKKNAIIRSYLDKLQEKFVEERSWKQLIDDLQEGIILINKDFQIQYKNKTLCSIFGIPLNSENKPPSPSKKTPDSEKQNAEAFSVQPCSLKAYSIAILGSGED